LSQVIKNLSLILPTLNEAGNIIEQIREVYRELPELLEIIVADDASTDGTIEIIESHFPNQIQTGRIRVLKRQLDFGLTPSLRDAVAIAKGSYLAWMDCDLSMPTEVLRQMAEVLESGNIDVCVGSRFVRGGKQRDWVHSGKDSRLEILLSTMLNVGVKKFLGAPVSDLTSGFVVVTRKALDGVSFNGKHGEYFMSLLAQWQRKGIRFAEVPYSLGTRQHGISKTFGTLKAIVLNSTRYAIGVARLFFTS